MIPPDIKILIADDMPTIRDLVKNQLKTMGFRNIIEAADGEQALNLLIQHESQDPKVRMVISDWNMPKMTGLEFLKQVRATDQWKNLPFILLTSEAERDQVTEAILAGVFTIHRETIRGKSFRRKSQFWLVKNTAENNLFSLSDHLQF